jgi:glycosyltransferase involved in cell wall biosynthesis
MSRELPLVSVIVPCFNQGRYLAEALTSVGQQTHEARECLIIDDGSSDDTREVASRFVDGDARYRYVHHANMGQAASRNRGLSMARGDLIQFLDADDVILPEKIDEQVAALSGLDGLKVAHCDYFHGRPERIREPYSPTRVSPAFIYRKPIYDLALRWETELSIPIHSFLFDARIFRDRRLRFDEALANHEDWDCWMRVFALEPASRFVDRVLAVYRTSGLVTRDHRVNYAGFRVALRKQEQAWRHDAIMSRLLGLMRRRIAHHYRGLLRREAQVSGLGDSLAQAYRRTVPWRFQQAVARFKETRRNPDTDLLESIRS